MNNILSSGEASWHPWRMEPHITKRYYGSWRFLVWICSRTGSCRPLSDFPPCRWGGVLEEEEAYGVCTVGEQPIDWGPCDVSGPIKWTDVLTYRDQSNEVIVTYWDQSNERSLRRIGTPRAHVWFAHVWFSQGYYLLYVHVLRVINT